MTAAAEWLTRWQPIAVHRAILVGVAPEQVSEAAGMSTRDVYERWQKWADGRRQLVAGHCAGRWPGCGEPGGARGITLRPPFRLITQLLMTGLFQSEIAIIFASVTPRNESFENMLDV